MGNPTIYHLVEDINPKTVALTGTSKVLIKYHSTAKATMLVFAHDGASINLDMNIIRNGEETAYGTELTVYNVSNNLFTFSAEDSLGRTVTQGAVAPMVDYVKPTCNVVDSRPDATGSIVLVCRGDYFNGSFGAQSNTLTVSYRYRLSGGSWSGYTGMTYTLSGNTYYASATLTGLDYEQSYDFEFRAVDALMTATSSAANVKSMPVFHWGENDFVFEVPVAVNGDAHIKGDLRLKGDGNYGNYLRFGDGSYCYIAELSDDAMTIKAGTIDFEANSLTLNGKSLAEHGVWTPTLHENAIDDYYAQRGWYCKVGNIVTVGFYIAAYCGNNSNTSIAIFGLPYTPAFASAGGGMCSGALMQTDKNFQCFVAEADTANVITIRVQACDGTADLELETSASGCRYPDNGDLTLSGTITYMTEA